MNRILKALLPQPGRFHYALGVMSGMLLLVSCQPHNQPQPFERQFLSLGTLVNIEIAGADPQTAQAATTAVQTMLQDFTTRWRPQGEGELAHINAALETGESIAVGAEAQAMLVQAKTLSVQSGGLFNPAIYRLVQLWGFDVEDRPTTPPPTEDAIAALLAQAPAMTDLQLDSGVLRSNNPAVQLDFGAYAKGVAVDRAIAMLRAHGIRNAIVNAGGDLRAIGQYSDADGARPWRIGIRHPRDEGMLAAVKISGDECVFTSGDYERFFIYQDHRYHHILDPRSGYPSTDFASVTVIHSDGATADAAATALMVAGAAQWRDVARAMGITQIMLVTNGGRILCTPAMCARTEFLTDTQPQQVTL